MKQSDTWPHTVTTIRVLYTNHSALTSVSLSIRRLYMRSLVGLLFIFLDISVPLNKSKYWSKWSVSLPLFAVCSLPVSVVSLRLPAISVDEGQASVLQDRPCPTGWHPSVDSRRSDDAWWWGFCIITGVIVYKYTCIQNVIIHKSSSWTYCSVSNFHKWATLKCILQNSVIFAANSFNLFNVVYIRQI